MRCWLFGHKSLRVRWGPLIQAPVGLGFRPFMDGVRVYLCDRCHLAYWEPYVDHDARLKSVQEQR